MSPITSRVRTDGIRPAKRTGIVPGGRRERCDFVLTVDRTWEIYMAGLIELFATLDLIGNNDVPTKPTPGALIFLSPNC